MRTWWPLVRITVKNITRKQVATRRLESLGSDTVGWQFLVRAHT